MRQVASGLHVAEARQRFMGLEVGTRMTVLELEAGLLVHSPIGVDPSAVAPLGSLRWVLAPNLLHHLYVGPWIEAGAEAWAAPGLAEKRRDLRFTGTVTDSQPLFGDDVALFPLRRLPMTNEVVVLHRPSRTLIVTDLVFNFTETAPWWTRTVMAGLLGYPGCRTTVLERWGTHRAVGREEVATLLEQDFDRLIMAHGEPIERGGKNALQRAFAWLLGPDEVTHR